MNFVNCVPPLPQGSTWVSDFVDRPSFWTDDCEPHTPISGVKKITWALWYTKQHNAAIKSSLNFAFECPTTNTSFVVRRWTYPQSFTRTTTKILDDTRWRKRRYMHWKFQQRLFNDRIKNAQRLQCCWQFAFLLLNKTNFCRFESIQRRDMLQGVAKVRTFYKFVILD